MYSIIVNNPHKRDLKLQYMNTDNFGFVVRFTRGIIPDEHMDLTNLDRPDKSNKKYQVNSNINLEVKP